MGSLLDYLLDFPDQISSEDMILWSAQIAWGMTYMESKRFVHRDLAARNILLSSKTQVLRILNILFENETQNFVF